MASVGGRRVRVEPHARSATMVAPSILSGDHCGVLTCPFELVRWPSYRLLIHADWNPVVREMVAC